MQTRIIVWRDWLVDLWWNRLPDAGGRVSRALLMLLSEGFYLIIWPTLAALLPLFALILGVLCGWLRFGAPVVFTQSFLIIGISITLGFLSGQLGFLFTIGYAIGDFLLYSNPEARFLTASDQLEFRIGIVITYIAMGTLAAIIPLVVRVLRTQFVSLLSMAEDVVVVLDTLLGVIIGGGLVYLYLNALPLLIRPMFMWHNSTPPINAVTPLQENAWIFVFLAGIVLLVRILIEYGAAASEPDVLYEYTRGLETVEKPLWERIPRWINILLSSAGMTLLVAGLLDMSLSVIIVFSAIAISAFVRWLLPARIPIWEAFMRKIPAILRLIALLIIGYLISNTLLSNVRWSQSFEPLIWSLALCGLAGALLFPETPSSISSERLGG